jgi:RNA polymerase sigma-70 factor (sigma-E family)
VGCSQNSLTTRLAALPKDLPQVKRGTSHTTPPQPLSDDPLIYPFRRSDLQRSRTLERPGDVRAKRTTMVADMEVDEAPADRMAEIYERSAPAGFRLAYLLTGDRALAEDLVQEAFLRFVGRLHHLRDPEAFDAYLRRTIVNLSKDVFRRRAVERSYLERRTAELREGHTDRDVAAYEAMRTALLTLPPRQRAAIVLRYYEDLHESDIADLLRCRPATVRSLVARGLETLRKIPEVTT